MQKDDDPLSALTSCALSKMMTSPDPVQEVAQAAVLYTKARDHFHDVLRKYVDIVLRKYESKTARRSVVKTPLPANVVRPTLKWALVEVMGPDAVSADEALNRLKAKGWAPNARDPKGYLAHRLSQTKDLFERDPARGRGFYRVRAGASKPVLPKTRRATESTAKKVAEKSAVMTDDDVLLRAMEISPKTQPLGNVTPKTQPLGNVTRVVVRGLLSTFKERVLFTAKDAAVCRPAPHNTRDGVHSALACLVRRGLIKDEGDGCFSIPDARKLEAALIISAKAVLFPD